MSDRYDMGQLAWQCRRGIKEVEVVLLPYFEQFFSSESEDRQALFVKLLSCHDPDLFEWFTYRSKPDDAELAEIVAHVLQRLATRSRT